MTHTYNPAGRSAVQRLSTAWTCGASRRVFSKTKWLKMSTMSTNLMEALQTRRDRAEKALLAAGVEGPALEALLNESAHLRHVHRVKIALAAAEDYYLEQAKLTRDDLTPESLAVHAAIIAYLDIVGVGGYWNVTGAGTARHPAFEKCGKGRKRATDGMAWNVAIEALTMPPSTWFFRANADGGISYGNYVTGESVSVEPVHGPAAWRLTLAREGLRRAAGLEPFFRAVPMKADQETLALWGRAVNNIMEELQQQAEGNGQCT